MVLQNWLSKISYKNTQKPILKSIMNKIQNIPNKILDEKLKSRRKLLQKLVFRRLIRRNFSELKENFHLWRDFIKCSKNTIFQKPQKMPSIDQNIISNQAQVIKFLEKEMDKKQAEHKMLDFNKGIYKFELIFMNHRAKIAREACQVMKNSIKNFDTQEQFYSSKILELQKEIENFSIKNKEAKEQGLENSYKKNLKINVDQIEETKKVGFPSSQATDLTSVGSKQPENLNVQGENETIQEAKEYLEFSNTGENIENNREIIAPDEGEADIPPDDGMTYLMSAEEQVFLYSK